MSQVAHIIGAGTPVTAALAINGGNYAGGGLTAAGTSKATATVLTASKNYISICSTGKSVSLPGGTSIGDDIDVYNGGSNALLVFVPAGSSDTVTTLSTLGGFTVSAAKGARFSKVTSTLWMVNYSK